MIEQILCHTKADRENVERTLRETFSTTAGRKTLAMLIKARHPMAPRFSQTNADTHAAAFRDGEASVVAFLWRYGSDSQDIPPTFPDSQNTNKNQHV